MLVRKFTRTFTSAATGLSLTLMSSLALSADGHEPPSNPFLADSPWPMTHRTPYSQGSSPYPAAMRRWDLRAPDYVGTGLTNPTVAMSPRYADGSRVYWGSTFGAVYKLAANAKGLPLIDRLDKPSGTGLDDIGNATSGAYTLVDHENRFFTVDGVTVLAYVDAVHGDAGSPIALERQFTLPDSVLRGDAQEDPIVGMTLLWDGSLAVATKLGTVAVMSRDFSAFHTVQLGDAQTGEEISNSISADETGGIYVVSEKAMNRVQWTGTTLSTNENDGAWRALYEAGGDTTGSGRLGPGSGSTPSLMGTGNGDRFVVITDGQELSHLVLFWRDEIPEDWQPIAEGKDRRIAAEVPVDFGDPARAATLSEQSVLVRGYGAVVVSNDYRNVDALPDTSGNDLIDNFTNGITVALSGFTEYQPFGVHKFEWDPVTRTLETAWVNTETSCPNGVPTMSASSNMFYCVGARWNAWTIEALDWNTGETEFSKWLGWNPLYNSFYAGLVIGDDGTMVSGTTLGVIEVDSR
ncbi:hypothetical protein [Alcanivorax sp. 1008]|uniref:hypothetical protein n=1 Tax=Alcanivorax sp. 1008 TaxID=2816853 RepID=UPI001E12AEA6|nr:hypothetical protein [Alcanivorax sp. 1008]MCC1495879.1 hypothetical protein [Alcanivorax sp. 1008]